MPYDPLMRWENEGGAILPDSVDPLGDEAARRPSSWLDPASTSVAPDAPPRRGGEVEAGVTKDRIPPGGRQPRRRNEGRAWSWAVTAGSARV
jgi:hypothetical protein